MKNPTELAGAFRAQGLKVTPQRQLLFRLLHANMTHPTAEALYAVASDLMPGISLRTVYQTLTDLTAMGELQLLDLGNGATRFDPNVGTHHHIVCRICNTVADVYVEGADGLDVAGLDGFTIDRSDIVFHGMCATCAHDSSVSIHQTPQNTAH